MHLSGNTRWHFISGCLISVGLIVLAVIPTEFIQSLPTFCVFKNLFGTECFGCGMTRALSSAMHGEFGDAWSYNKLVALILPSLFLIILFFFTKFILLFPNLKSNKP